MSDLLTRAQETARTRQEQYGDWKATAHRYDPDDLTAYPAAMIRAKLARDPDCRRDDTRIDLVNYLAMLDEVSPRAVTVTQKDMSSVDLIAELRRRRESKPGYVMGDPA
jgi:hypothetical protein